MPSAGVRPERRGDVLVEHGNGEGEASRATGVDEPLFGGVSRTGPAWAAIVLSVSATSPSSRVIHPETEGDDRDAQSDWAQIAG